MCSLRDRSSPLRHLCGATLIAPRLALTAAYCVSAPGGAFDPVLWCGLRDLSGPQAGTYDVLGTARVTR